jgi:hypothetical protein
MKNRRIFVQLFAAVSAMGLVSSQAFANLCYSGIVIHTTGAGPDKKIQVDNQPFLVSPGNTSLTLSCGVGTTTTVSGRGTAITGAAGTHSIQAFKVSGIGSAGIEGMDSNGNVVCGINDVSADGFGSAITLCPSTAVTWRASASF